jgi:hypothetical protein
MLRALKKRTQLSEVLQKLNRLLNSLDKNRMSFIQGIKWELKVLIAIIDQQAIQII